MNTFISSRFGQKQAKMAHFLKNYGVIFMKMTNFIPFGSKWTPGWPARGPFWGHVGPLRSQIMVWRSLGPTTKKKTGIFGHFLGRKMSQKMTIFDHFWPIRPKLVPQTPHRYRFQSYDGKNGPPGRPEGRFRGVHFRSFWTLWGSQIRVWKGVWPPQTPHRYRFQSYNGKKWTPGQPGVHFGVIWTLWGLIPQVVRHS